MRHLPAALACLLLLVAGASAAQDSGDAERRLEKARNELEQISAERNKIEGKRGAAARELRKVDRKVGDAARELSAIERAIADEQQALAQLQEERDALRESLTAQRSALAAQLRAAYALGEDAPLKLLLSQDHVADGQRMLAYHGYLERARSRRIQSLTTQMQTLDELQQKVAAKRAQLDAALAQQSEQLATLQRARDKRAGTVAQLDSRYRDRGERQKALGRDVKSLEKLLARLRAAAEKAAKARAAAAAKARDKVATGKASTTPPPASRATGPQVGGLSWPLSGALLAGYGGTLPDGRRSDGVLIGSSPGAQVTAVADGQVVFADWMTGYGLIMIIDHGNGYMSLYAHNEALLRDVGDRVQRGDALARVGSSGGHGQPALYFELRHDGDPVDPKQWLQRR